jgi:hypothetical protein
VEGEEFVPEVFFECHDYLTTAQYYPDHAGYLTCSEACAGLSAHTDADQRAVLQNCPVSCGLCADTGPGGSYFPVCALGFADNRNGAYAVCRELGFESGTLVNTSRVGSEDAVYVGVCRGGDRLDRCSGGSLLSFLPSFLHFRGGDRPVDGQTDSVAQQEECATGSPVGVGIVCTKKVAICVY